MPKGQKPKNTFSRPSIDLTPHGKEWRDAEIGELEVGDLVRGEGAIAVLRPIEKDDHGSYRTVEFVSGRSGHYPLIHVVHAFTRKS